MAISYAAICAKQANAQIENGFSASKPELQHFNLDHTCSLNLKGTLPRANLPALYVGVLRNSSGEDLNAVVHGEFALQFQGGLSKSPFILESDRVFEYTRGGIPRIALIFPKFRRIEEYIQSARMEMNDNPRDWLDNFRKIMKDFIGALLHLQKHNICYGRPIFVVVRNGGAVLAPYFSGTPTSPLHAQLQILAQHIERIRGYVDDHVLYEQFKNFEQSLVGIQPKYLSRLEMNPLLLSAKEKLCFAVTIHSVMRSNKPNRKLISQLGNNWRQKVKESGITELVTFLEKQDEIDDEEESSSGGPENTGVTLLNFIRNFIVHDPEDPPSRQFRSKRPSQQITSDSQQITSDSQQITSDSPSSHHIRSQHPSHQIRSQQQSSHQDSKSPFQQRSSQQVSKSPSLVSRSEEFWQKINSKVSRCFLENAYFALLNADDKSGRF